MEKLNIPGLLERLLLLLILVPLLALAPRQHLADQALQRARRALEYGSLSAASAHIASAASRQANRADLWELAGRYALEGNDPQKAIEFFRQAQQAEGLTAWGQLWLGDAYQQTGNLPAALLAWQSAAAQDYAAPEVYTRLSETHRILGDFPAAIQDLQKLVAWQPEDAGSHYRLGLLTATQDPEAALKILATAAQLDAGYISDVDKFRQGVLAARLQGDAAYMLLASGRGLAWLGEWDLAAEAFHQSTLERPDYAEAWAYLGEARQHLLPQKAASTQGSGEQAPKAETRVEKDGLAELQKALQLNPQSLAANTFLALYWQRQEKYDQALAAMQTAVDQAPNNPTLQAELGSLLATQGDLQAAAEAYQAAVKLAPNQVDFLVLQANFSMKYSYQLGQVALPAARRAVALAPQSPAALDLMAQVMIQLGDQVSARRFLERALAANPEYAPAHLHIGLVYLLEGDEARAQEEFQRARTLSPGSPAAEQSGRLLDTYFP